MSFTKLLTLGLLYLPVGFVLGHFYTNYRHDTSQQETTQHDTTQYETTEHEAVDSTSLSPWEARYHSLELKFKEMSQLVDTMYRGKGGAKDGAADKIDTKKLLASVQSVVNNQYSELESDVKQNIVDLCQSINAKKGTK